MKDSLSDTQAAMAAVRKAPPTAAEARAEQRVFDQIFAPPPNAERPAGVGWDRYSLEAKLGSGGCSVVFVGRDKALDRQVAIKLLRGPEALVDQGRLIREARALAKLSHPNIVEVFDVGVYDESGAGVSSLAPAERGIYIVLELVEGVPLDEWLLHERPSWRTALAKMIDAGRGLAAAHAAGVIHRDFKPGNVVLAKDGRPRVLDFGLASLAEEPAHVTKADSGVDLPSPDGLTATGAVMGTPAYMAPEQHEGRGVDEATDQYAFCVALYSALWGERPFTGGTVLTLYEHKLAGLSSRPKVDLRGAPRRIHDAVVRATSVKPADRWPSMAALLTELELAARPARWRRWTAVAAVLAVAGGAWATVADDDTDPCAGDTLARQLADAWSPQVQRDAAAAFSATQTVGAGETYASIAPRLSSYAEQWTRSFEQWCRAPDRASLASDRRLRCLRDRLAAFRGLVARIGTPDAEVIARARDAIAGLAPPASCEEGEHPLSAEAQALRDEIATIAGAQLAGGPEDGLRQLDAIAARVESAGVGAVRSHYLRLRGDLESDAGRFDVAADLLERAYHEAEAADSDGEATDIATLLIHVHSFLLGDLQRAQAWARHAEASLPRAPSPERESNLLRERAVLAVRMSRFAEAHADNARAIEIRRDEFGDDDPRTIIAVEDSASILAAEGRYEESLAVYEDVLDRTLKAYGGLHPRTADAQHNVGAAWVRRGDAERGVAVLREALALRSEFAPPHDPGLAETRNVLAAALVFLKRYDEAAPLYQQTVDAMQATPNLLPAVRALQGLGVIARNAGDYEEAARVLRQVIDATESEDARLDRAHAYANLGAVYAQAEDLARALQSFEAAHATAVAALGPGHPELAQFHGALSQVYVLMRRFEDAQLQLELALKIADAAGDIASSRKLRVTGIELARAQGEGERADAELSRLVAEAAEVGDGAWQAQLRALSDDIADDAAP